MNPRTAFEEALSRQASDRKFRDSLDKDVASKIGEALEELDKLMSQPHDLDIEEAGVVIDGHLEKAQNGLHELMALFKGKVTWLVRTRDTIKRGNYEKLRDRNSVKRLYVDLRNEIYRFVK